MPGILDVIGVGMLGPTIIAHGTDEQKQRYLGPMLHGDEVWCQLFSEPAAGSDLAGIQSRAKQDDGGWVAQRAEGVDDQRAVLRLRPAARPHRPRRAQAQGPDDVHRPDGRRGRHGARPAADHRRRRVQRGVLRRRQARRRRRRRRRRQRLGHRADDAHVRAPDDRLRLGGHGLPARALRRAHRRRTRSPRATARSASGSATSRPSCSR